MVILAAASLALLALPVQKGTDSIPVEKVKSFYVFKMADIDGANRSMSDYRGKVVLVVNVATFCGNTPQYAGLEALYEKYKSKGLVVVGFPCNDFGAQEPGTEKEIKKFCDGTYHVTFPLFSKVHVKGPEQTGLYRWLVAKTGGKDVEWNFGKFLIGKDGQVAGRFNPRLQPDSEELTQAIEKALAG